MTIKKAILEELEALVKEFKIPQTTIGVEIAGTPSLMKRLRSDELTVTDKTLDACWRYVLTMRGQKEMKFKLK